MVSGQHQQRTALAFKTAWLALLWHDMESKQGWGRTMRGKRLIFRDKAFALRWRHLNAEIHSVGLSQAPQRDHAMALIHSLMMGAVAGMRSMHPFATVTTATGTDVLTVDNAGLQLWADSRESAPHRLVPAGMVQRVVTGLVTGAALAPRHQRGLGAIFGAATAMGASYLAFHWRMRELERFGRREREQ
jgi:uncharacterized membrane protein